MSRGFLSRWARLKAENQAPAQPEALPKAPLDSLPAAAEPEPAPSDTAPPEAGEGGVAGEEEAFDPSTLPEIDSLTAESDYSAFMDARVPVDLRNRALRKLWTSDPVYAVRDGLNDYDEDFRTASLAGQVVRSAWDALRGYAPPEDEPKDGTAEEKNADGQPVVEEGGVDSTPGDVGVQPNREGREV